MLGLDIYGVTSTNEQCRGWLQSRLRFGLDHNVAINYGSHGGFRESRALNPVSCYKWCKHCTHSTKYNDFFKYHLKLLIPVALYVPKSSIRCFSICQPRITKLVGYILSILILVVNHETFITVSYDRNNNNSSTIHQHKCWNSARTNVSVSWLFNF